MVARRRAKSRQPSYIQLFQETFTAIIEHWPLSLPELRLWLVLFGTCEWGNWVPLTQREMAGRLKVSQAFVSRCLRRLVDEGLVLRDAPVKGRTWVHRLPTVIVQHGPLEDLGWKRPRDLQKQSMQRLSGKASASVPRKGRSASSRRR